MPGMLRLRDRPTGSPHRFHVTRSVKAGLYGLSRTGHDKLDFRLLIPTAAGERRGGDRPQCPWHVVDYDSLNVGRAVKPVVREKSYYEGSSLWVDPPEWYRPACHLGVAKLSLGNRGSWAETPMNVVDIVPGTIVADRLLAFSSSRR